ncbi:MAG: pentapeptide repeat-containing protein [Leptolyngbyaceae cyanobacterium SM1_4_3]|nr:pentapeptide repeat-containing protein [Leptolyngbyaceae cyanobacterium SM1_4_3]
MSSNLSKAELERAELVNSDLRRATLDDATLYQAHCSGSDFSGASFNSTNLKETNFSDAKLCNAALISADLFDADLSNADLSGANLTGARLVRTKVCNANFEECIVYGTSVWDLEGVPDKQQNLIITPVGEPNSITVDDLEIAQFIYLLLRNEKIRNVIDNMVQRAVLILGRFTPERELVLNAIREELRKSNYLPILFDFEKPSSRNILESVSTIAHLSRFVIADITEPQAIPGELTHIVKNVRVPILPIFQPKFDENTKSVTNEWGMFWDLAEEDHVLGIYDYPDLATLLANFKRDILTPAEEEVEKISIRRQVKQKKKTKTRSRRSQKFLEQ